MNIRCSLQLFWGAIVTAAFCTQLLTVDFLPAIHQDEAQITDYGRLAFAPLSGWSVTWIIPLEKPLYLWSYLGPLISETAYQIEGSQVGPRIASLLGGAIAASVALGWLLARQTPKPVAFCLCLCFLLDPLFVLSQRMARADSWVMAFCLGACWLLRSVISQQGTMVFLRIALAGVLTAISALIWPSAAFLYPIILVELIQSLKSFKREKSVYTLLILFLSAAAITAAILLLPIRHQFSILWGDWNSMLNLNIDSTRTFSNRVFALFDIQNWLKVLKTFIKTYSPFLPLLACLGLFYRRPALPLLACLFTLFIIFASLIYEFRLLYLIPYFLLFASGISLEEPRTSTGTFRRKIGKLALAFTTLWAIFISLFVRSAFAAPEKNLFTSNKLEIAAKAAIGPGNYNVFLGFTYEFYYTGRRLGWKIFTPYIRYSYHADGTWHRTNDYEPKEKFLMLLKRMDFAIFAEGSITPDLLNRLKRAGLVHKRTVNLNDRVPTVENKDRLEKILIQFLYGFRYYGPYEIYGRNRT